ncbi:hypothetical protein ABMA28_008154 [Loxostege sticticalis]|uniref:UDP-glucuronosyltransferase n=1 Tax=Loxostege sticticalis TaxID=481309 RepID=A0ABD0SIE8_LOXSC
MKLSLCTWLVLATLSCTLVADAARILVVFPMPSPSHVILGDAVVKHLAAAGHDITYITPVPKKTFPQNVQQVDVSENFKAVPTELLDIKTLLEKKFSLSMDVMFQLMNNIHNTTFHNPNVQKFLRDANQQFDLVIAEWMHCELYSAFAGIFNAPYIWVSTVEPHWMVLSLIDEAPNPAYSPDPMFSSNSLPFTFVERVQELWSQIRGYYWKEIVFPGKTNEIYSGLAPYFKMRGREPPNYDELRFNASVMFGNSHVSLGEATRLPQNYKPIGGYHINTDVAPLPADLQKLMDDSKNGVIYFSMGSNLKSKHFPEELKRKILKMFGGLKQTVLWKFEEVLPDLPSNVHILQWAPQPSILAHPNCVLFITHGGLLSTTETTYFAKPIIGIPAFADQFINVDRAVAKGFAKRVDLSYNMADELGVAINEMLQNPSYTNKVKELSFVYHHRIASPSAELVHWTDHVIKTRGAPHLRSPAISVPFYQKMYLDLLALIAVALLGLRAVVRLIFKKKSDKKVKKQ